MRLLLNLLIATALLLVFNAIEWLTLSHDGGRIELDHLTWPAFGSVLLVAVILWLVGIAVGMLYIASALFTFGLMLLAYPFLGWAVLKLTAHFMPGSLVLNGFWITALCGFLLLIAKISPPRPNPRPSPRPHYSQ